jgi:AraC family transcriptional activator of pobA
MDLREWTFFSMYAWAVRTAGMPSKRSHLHSRSGKLAQYSPQHVLLEKFIRLVDNYYIEKRTVEEYADLLFVTPNHLSQSIKSAAGKNALSYINERIISEAKSMIQYTGLEMAEIAYNLNFSDPANFGKFIKRLTGLTPLEFRKQKAL